MARILKITTYPPKVKDPIVNHCVENQTSQTSLIISGIRSEVLADGLNLGPDDQTPN